MRENFPIQYRGVTLSLIFSCLRVNPLILHVCSYQYFYSILSRTWTTVLWTRTSLNHVPAWNNGHVLCILITRYKYSSSGAILYYWIPNTISTTILLRKRVGPHYCHLEKSGKNIVKIRRRRGKNPREEDGPASLSIICISQEMTEESTTKVMHFN